MTNLGPSGGSKDPPGPLLGCAYGPTTGYVYRFSGYLFIMDLSANILLQQPRMIQTLRCGHPVSCIQNQKTGNEILKINF